MTSKKNAAVERSSTYTNIVLEGGELSASRFDCFNPYKNNCLEGSVDTGSIWTKADAMSPVEFSSQIPKIDCVLVQCDAL